MSGAQLAPPNMPTAASCCAGSVDSSTVNAESTGMRSARPACLYCLTRLTPMPPGLIVRYQEINPLVAPILGDLAEDLVHLIVLVGGHVEKRATVLAGVARRPGIRADQEGFGFGHRLVDRLENIGE